MTILPWGVPGMELPGVTDIGLRTGEMPIVAGVWCRD
jgi:hypothetical protein